MDWVIGDLRTVGANAHRGFAADHLAGFLENAGGAGVDQPIKSAPDRRVGGDPAGAVGAAAHRADHEIGELHGRAPGSARHLGANPAHGGEAALDGGARPADALDNDRLGRTAAGADVFGEPVAIEALASEREQNGAADVRVRGERAHHAIRVVVRITAGKSDEMNALVVGKVHYSPRHMVGALDQVGDDDHVANAFSSVIPQKSIGDHDSFPAFGLVCVSM
jgi:hypothetical protein